MVQGLVQAHKGGGDQWELEQFESVLATMPEPAATDGHSVF